MSRGSAVVASLLLFCPFFSSLRSVVFAAGSGCVAYLPQSEEELRQLVEESPSPKPSLDYGDEARLFPNISFNCSGSVVGWSLIAPLHDPPPGRSPLMNIWSPLGSRKYKQERKNKTVLIPCLKEVISQERQLYLYENTTMQPLEFKPGDILGMVVRDPDQNNSIFTPYMLPRNTFVAYYRKARNAKPTETINLSRSDHLVPLLFLHICYKAERDYEECVREYRRSPPTCVQDTSAPETSSEGGSEGGSSNGESRTILAVALGVPLCLALLVVSLLLALILAYIRVSRRRKRKRNRKEKDITESTDVNGEAQPYAEPLSSRTHTPLPPAPAYPPPPPGLSVQQPTYAVLSGPTPSPPPPYGLDLDYSRPPPLGELPSPQYESIDGHERKAALLRQNATETSADGDGYSRLQGTNIATDHNFHN